MHIYAADVSALAESVAALTAVGAVATWVRRTSTSTVSRLRRRRHKELVGVLSNEVAAGPGWDDVHSEPGSVPRSGHSVRPGRRQDRASAVCPDPGFPECGRPAGLPA